MDKNSMKKLLLEEAIESEALSLLLHGCIKVTDNGILITNECIQEYQANMQEEFLISVLGSIIKHIDAIFGR